VGRPHHRGRLTSARALRRARLAAQRKSQPRVSPLRLACANRKSLLTGTALASTLILASLLVPAPARADVTCPPGTFPPPGPIAIINPGDDISCVNVYDRTNGAGSVIDLRTNGANEFVNLYNSGALTATNAAGNAFGIQGYTNGPSGSPVAIQNLGDITASASSLAYGIRTLTSGDASPIG
jgi:autotransporter family porin